MYDEEHINFQEEHINSQEEHINSQEEIEDRVHSVSDLEPVFLPRYDSGIEEMNWLWGCSTLGPYTVWGAPRGKITLLSGVSGIGKSRAMISIAKSFSIENLAKKKFGYKVLYFQNEVDIGTFSSWVRDNGEEYRNFYVSSSCSLSKQMEDMSLVRPQIAVIDSVNMIEEFGGGRKKNVQHIIKEFRKICDEYGTHIILLGHLNKDGSTKGSTDLTHMVDTVFKASATEIENFFCIKVGHKHRYGPTGENYFTVWTHKDSGAVCQSNTRYYDKKWLECFGETCDGWLKHNEEYQKRIQKDMKSHKLNFGRVLQKLNLF